MLEQLATLDKLHDEVNTISLLENVVHANNERMVDLVEDQFFDLKRLNWLMLNNDIFSDTFHGIIFITCLAVNQEYFAESTSTDDTDELEVVPGDLRHSSSSIEQAWAGFAPSCNLIKGQLGIQRPFSAL